MLTNVAVILSNTVMLLNIITIYNIYFLF